MAEDGRACHKLSTEAEKEKNKDFYQNGLVLNYAYFIFKNNIQLNICIKKSQHPLFEMKHFLSSLF